jgi:hypothetical protein|tara:strand:- start:6227 stop:6604 length:378 start_codon:yes stop_codon:yes gene_type:complete
MSVISGTVAFANLTEHEVYNGTSTGKYSVVLSLDDVDAEQLQDAGVKIRTYQNQAQRKFSTKFEEFPVIDNEGEPVSRGSVRYGDKVRIKYNLGKPHPVHGTSVYLQAVRVVEKGEAMGEDDEGF